MIKVQDWIASIPDEEKHIAYVGEGLTERRVFYLTGGDWEKYRNWTFHLDMAFDPESETTRDSRQVVQTTKNYKKTASETGISTEEVTTKETFAVDSETVDADGLTDVATLTRRVMDDGIQLTWTVLRQQTQYPGKLWATIRAMGESTDEVKKSAVMVFEVDPAVAATPAKPATVNEFQQMEADLNVYYRNAMNMLDSVNISAESAQSAASGASWYADQAAQSAAQVEQSVATVLEAVDNAQSAEKAASADATVAAEHRRVVVEEADAAKDACATAKAYMLEALVAAQDAADSYIYAEEEAVKCEEYVQQCADHVSNMTTAVDNLFYNRVNVRDYGAIGDGVADDRAAIIAAFEQAKTMLPCEVYFPAGTYGISNGITIYMEYGTGGLRVRGAGRDTTTIKYLDSYNPRRNDIHWYALRIWPVGMPNTKPTSEDEYLHDISYMGLTVYDPDPCAHATHASKGDSTQEETHGFDLHYCKGVSVTDCQFITVGDEAIDICACRDVIVMNNRLVGSPGAGPGGGAISINDGCNGVVVSGNTINGSAPDEVLADGTVITKKNNGITVESLSLPVQNVTISGNSIRHMHGVGVKMYTTIEGTGVDNIIVANNVISGCDYGIITEGTILKSGLKIHNNLIADCTANAMDMVGISDMSVCGNTFRNIGADRAVKANAHCANSTQLYADNLFENVAFGAMYVAGSVTVKDCVFNGVGVTENIPSTKTEYGIYNYQGDLIVSGCVMKDVRAKVLKAGISRNNSTTGTLRIENTDIELMSASLVANAGGDAITVGGSIFGGVIGGRIAITQANAIVQGVTVVSSNMGGHGITLNASGVSVTGCNIQMNKVSSKGAIGEVSGVNNNIIANNIANQAIITSGVNTVAVNNIVTT